MKAAQKGLQRRWKPIPSMSRTVLRVLSVNRVHESMTYIHGPLSLSTQVPMHLRAATQCSASGTSCRDMGS